MEQSQLYFRDLALELQGKLVLILHGSNGEEGASVPATETLPPSCRSLRERSAVQTIRKTAASSRIAPGVVYPAAGVVGDVVAGGVGFNPSAAIIC